MEWHRVNRLGKQHAKDAKNHANLLQKLKSIVLLLLMIESALYIKKDANNICQQIKINEEYFDKEKYLHLQLLTLKTIKSGIPFAKIENRKPKNTSRQIKNRSLIIFIFSTVTLSVIKIALNINIPTYTKEYIKNTKNV